MKNRKKMFYFLSHLNKYINLLLSLSCTLTILFIITVNTRIHRKTLKIAAKPSSSVGKRVPAAAKRISLGKNQKVNIPLSQN